MGHDEGVPRDVTLHDPSTAAEDASPRPGGMADAWTNDDTLGAIPQPDLEHQRGQIMGRYVLLEPIGRGGMGVVYSAYDPELDRRVALKLLRSPTDGGAQARLAREAQAMAKLGHPNVIAVHDVGRFDGGVFVAMELVDGQDLRAWMTGSHSWSEALAVLRQAGEGLAAAHRAGLVHRDFKPANVLVGHDGTVKVGDFGLARQVDRGLDSHELKLLERGLEVSGPSGSLLPQDLTHTGAVMGTPAYMAPEQHGRRTVDARTDQFSFCVTLYEALFGRRPFDGHNRLVLAMQTNRGTFEPPPRGHPVPTRITRAVLRGLSPDPDDRFPDMATLLAVLRYDPRRRRRRALLGGALVIGLGVGTYGYVRSPQTAEPACPDARPALRGAWDDAQRLRLRDAFEASELPYAEANARYAIQRLDGWAGSWVTAEREACEATRVVGVQSQAALELRQACLDRQRKALAAVTQLLASADDPTIGRAEHLVGSLPDPEACADTEVLGRVLPPTDPEVRAEVDAVRDQLAEIGALEAAGRYREGLLRAEAAQRAADATAYVPVRAEARWRLGGLQGRDGKHVLMQQTLHEGARLAMEAGDDPLVAEIWLDLAWDVGMGSSMHTEALRWADYAAAVIERLDRPDPLVAELLCLRGTVLWDAHDSSAALEQLRACLEIRERTEPDSPSVALSLSYVGNALVDLGRYEEAERVFRRGLDIATRTSGAQHPRVASMHNGLGVVLYHLHRLEPAEQQYQLAYDLNLALLGPDHPDLLFSQGNIASCRRERGDLRGALEAMQRVEALVDENFPPVHREVGITQHNIGELLALQRRHEEAIARFDRAIAVREEVHGADDRYVANSLTARGESRLALGRDAEALADFERALAIRTATHEPLEHDFGRTRFGLAQALWRTGGDQARALRLAEAAAADFASADSPLKQRRRDAVAAWRRERGVEAPTGNPSPP